MLQYTAYLVLAPLAAIISVGVLLHALRYRASRNMPALSWLMFAVLGWLTCNIFELVMPTEAATLFWAKLSYLFVVSTPSYGRDLLYAIPTNISGLQLRALHGFALFL